MKKEKDISEEFTTLNNQVVVDNNLKSYIVNYVATRPIQRMSRLL